MEELRSLDTNVLVDMLSVHTAEYLKLAGDINNESRYAKSFLTIKAIQHELESRKQKVADSSIPDPSTRTPHH
ncbi:MAG: hypothetical protein ABIT05_02150 [Chitinophagaceae bacterium]